jgi:ATP-binding protein involved in chromosome partitioning
MFTSIKKAVFIGSGKGGVGKSTVAVNLAVALGLQGYSIGLLDADIYGPSVPIMLGLRQLSPRIYLSPEGKEKVIPFTKFGIKSASIGFFLDEAQSLLWRGPMLHGILQKMLFEIEWGDLDLLLIDLPPGTGDVPLSLSQLLQIHSSIIVSTPQEVAMLDAIKAINTFHQLQIPLMGIVENMAGFTPPGSQEIFHIFGEGKAKELAQRFDSELLVSIPLCPSIRQGCDEGFPAAFHQGNDNRGAYFRELAEKVINRLFNQEEIHQPINTSTV